MEQNSYRVYGYRWVVLAVFMFVNLTIQILWISYAPITGLAAEFYRVSDLEIGLFAMIFMIAFIPLSIPVSWAIDTWGFRKSVGLGAMIMAVFGIVRGLAGGNYGMAVVGTIGLGVAQPFLMNSWTTVAAKWFPVDERALAVSLATIANLVGTAIGLVATPELIKTSSIADVQMAYGVVAAVSAVLFVIFSREKPATPPCPEGMETRALMFDGLKHAFTVRRFWLYLAVSFIGMGIFNGVMTWIENIVRPRGFQPDDAGLLGGVFLLGGVIGAAVLSALSDKQRKRQRYLMIGLGLAIPGLIGVTYATSFWLLVVSAFAMGFFMVSANPIGMQYAAEITNPTPEGTSNGVISLFGQSAVVFVYVMEALKAPDGSFTPALLLCVALLVVCLVIVTQLKDAGPETPKEPVYVAGQNLRTSG
jgi:MFS family permease